MDLYALKHPGSSTIKSQLIDASMASKSGILAMRLDTGVQKGNYHTDKTVERGRGSN